MGTGNLFGDDEESIIENIKFVEKLLVDEKNKLNVEIQKWRDTTKLFLSTQLEIDNHPKQKVLPELHKQQKLADAQNNLCIEDTNEHKQMKEFDRQEVALKKVISGIENQIECLKTVNDKAENDKKLANQKFLTKISKTFTGTIFDYQGPNVSGFVQSSGLSTFDLDPTKLSEQQISDSLWDIVAKESGEDWSDILEL